jgi:hypothetical protein
MKYSFTCPAPCNHEIKVEANNDDEAINKIMAEGKTHAQKAHPDMPPMTEDQMKLMLRAGMKRM